MAQGRFEEGLRGLLRRARAGDRQGRDRLTSLCRRLLHEQIDSLLRLADEANDAVVREDLQSLGDAALEKAIETFDPAAGLNFSFYLSQWARSCWIRSPYIRNCSPARSFLRTEDRRQRDMNGALGWEAADYNFEDLAGVVVMATPAVSGLEEGVVADIMGERLKESLAGLPLLQKWSIKEAFDLDSDLFIVDASLRSVLGLSIRAHRSIRRNALLNLRRRLSAEALPPAISLGETAPRRLNDQLFFLGNLLDSDRSRQSTEWLSGIEQLAAGWQSISRGLERLDEDHQLAVYLRYGFDGAPRRSFFETQQILDIDAKTCNRVICSASSYLLRQLEGRGGGLPSSLRPITWPTESIRLRIPLYFREDLFIAEQFQILEASASSSWRRDPPVLWSGQPWREYLEELLLLSAACRERGVRLSVSPQSVGAEQSASVEAKLTAVSDFHVNLRKLARL